MSNSDKVNIDSTYTPTTAANERNLSWLSAQQQKLAKYKQMQQQQCQSLHHQVSHSQSSMTTTTTIAFSNPIYDHIDIDKDDVIYHSVNNITINEPSQSPPSTPTPANTTKPLLMPVPKPRKSTNKSRLTFDEPRPISSNLDNLAPNNTNELKDYENVKPVQCLDIPKRRSRSIGSAEQSPLTSAYFESELPAKMEQILNEINSLAKSMKSEKISQTHNVDSNFVSEQQLNKNDSPPPRRKRIQVQSNLFKFSFSSSSEVESPIPPLSPTTLATITAVNENQGSIDSGVFSNFSTIPASHGEESPESPPPRLPPRKPPKPVPPLPTDSPPSLASSSFSGSASSSCSSSISSSSASLSTVSSTSSLTDKKSSKSKTTDNVMSTTKTPTSNPTMANVQHLPISLYHNSEPLSMEHLHLHKLSLQRSGYLWKTGPNYRSFKYRWCILYRHNMDALADANFSYYFNRSSISASLSGKIMINEIEFVCITESVSSKTRMPRLKVIGNGGEKNVSATTNALQLSNSDGSNDVHFLEIGVRSRQGRVYLFAARASIDQQLWMHAFGQALCLHAFRNKELYHFGYICARFTITTGWNNCFALLTTDRYLYIFEHASGDTNNQPNEWHSVSVLKKMINCKSYHVFNLRKTVQISRLDEHGGMIGETTNSSYGAGYNDATGSSSTVDNLSLLECKHGFSLTQTGGRVVYVKSDFESHIGRWYRSIRKFWRPPESPDKIVLEEQYLTKNNIPVAIDKCVKFLDTFTTLPPSLVQQLTVNNILTGDNHNMTQLNNNNSNNNLFGAEVEQQPPLVLANCTKLLTEMRMNAWNVHLLPAKHSSTQISLLLLLYLRSMNQCIFTEILLPQWLQVSTTIVTNDEQVHKPMVMQPHSVVNDKVNVENSVYAHNSNLELAKEIPKQTQEQTMCEQFKQLLKLLPPVNYATLRRIIIHLANANLNYPLSTSLCKALVFSKQKSPMVSLTAARTLLTTLIRNHLWLFDVTKEEVDKEIQMKRVAHLIVNQHMEDQSQSKLSPVSINKSVNSNYHQKVEMGGQTMSSSNVKSNSALTMLTTSVQQSLMSSVGMHTSAPSTVVDTRQVSSLIIGIKVLYDSKSGSFSLSSAAASMQTNLNPTTVNVHLNRDTTAKDVLEMVLDKEQLSLANRSDSHYSLFEIVCYRRLVRIVNGNEHVLPIILSWSNWPSQWSAEAALECRPTETLYQVNGSLALLHCMSTAGQTNVNTANKGKGQVGINGLPHSSGSGTVDTPSSSDSKSTKGLTSTFRSTQSMKATPISRPQIKSNSIMMSIVSYCGLTDSRPSTRKVLVEFSCGCVYLHCKKSHKLLGQFPFIDLWWYVGAESIAQTQVLSLNKVGVDSSQKTKTINTIVTNTTTNPSSSTNIGLDIPQSKQQKSTMVPALTLVERKNITTPQSKNRLNFGQTLVFNSWNELHQWIVAFVDNDSIR